jgi:RNA:NAD 2'-phosphotransferase (TPT1/KptA family)
MDAMQRDVEAVRALTPEQKLAVAESLIAQAWELKEAWIRARHPERSEEEVRTLARRAVGAPAS